MPATLSAALCASLRFFLAIPSNQLGQAEVEHLHGAIRADHDIGRFQIAMDDAARMRRGECIGDGDRDRSTSFSRMPWRGINASRLLPRTYSITMKSMPLAYSIS